MIKNFNELKKQQTVIKLIKKQSEFDQADNALSKSHFTRSLDHSVTYLVFYAGLNLDQRQSVVDKLAIENLTCIDLNQVIDAIDWKNLIQDKQLSKFTILTPNPKNFFEQMEKNCNSLYKVLKSDNSKIHVKQEERFPLTVTFKTTVEQNIEWNSPFQKIEKYGKNYWQVKNFGLSPALAALARNGKQENKLGNFTLRSGDTDEVELLIVAPNEKEGYFQKDNMETNIGIYQSFIGLGPVFGIPSVDEVKVELVSEASFSVKGASVKQKQIAKFISKGVFHKSSTQTVIIVEGLDVLFRKTGIFANFLSPAKNEFIVSEEAFNNGLYIDLIDKENGETPSVCLVPRKMEPKHAYEFLFEHAVEARIEESSLQKESSSCALA